ncbi:MAG: transketolase C-terminal domain-containing protein [Steroidobacteraceae bacterium]
MKALRDVFGDTLVQLADSHPNLLVLDADLANSTKADKFAAAHPDRFLEMGIAEQNCVGVATGLSTLGFIPWLSSFAVFFTHRALDPLRMLVAQTHANVKIGAGYAGLLTGYTGKTHQDVQDLAIMRAMPGMTVLAPADEVECESMIRWATAYEGPVYLRLSREASPVLFDQDYRFEAGKTYRLREGSDLLMISTGTQSARCVAASDELAAQDISAGVLHVPSIKPVNIDEIVQACEPFPVVFTVEEHTVLGGLGGLVSEVLAEQLPKRVIRLGIEDTWGESAPNEYLLDRFGLSAAGVSARISARLRHTKI